MNQTILKKDAVTALCDVSPIGVKFFSKTLDVTTIDRLELINLSGQIRGFVEETQIIDGQLHAFSLHTTAGLFVNEWQDALLADAKALFSQLVPQTSYYKHNDPALSDCYRRNADSHLRNVIANHNVVIPIAEGRLVLGEWQSLIFAEFDGPNRRKVFVQIFGV